MDTDTSDPDPDSSTFPEIIIGYANQNNDEYDGLDEEEDTSNFDISSIADSTPNSEQDFQKMTLVSLERTTTKQSIQPQKSQLKTASNCCLLI